MYVHISASQEKILKQIIPEKVTRNGTLITSTQKLQEKKRGQESYCMGFNFPW